MSGRPKLDTIAGDAVAVLQALPFPEVVANEALHLRNNHPNSLRATEGLWRPVSKGAKVRRFLRLAWQNAVAPIFARAGLRGGLVLPKARVLLVSHHLGGAGNPADMYYGDLADRLEQAGVTTSTVAIDHGRGRVPLAATGSSRRHVLPKRLGIVGEYRITARLVAGWWRLVRWSAAHRGHGGMAGYAASSAFAPASRAALRLADQIAHIARQVRPDIIVSTLEGHGWERVVFHSVRQALPDVRCVGYTHAPILPFHPGLTVRIGHGYDPDVVLVPGDVHLRALAPEIAPGREVGVLGSPKSIRFDVDRQAREGSRMCLLLPEGLVDEVDNLLALAVEQAALMPDIRFRVRMHPALPVEVFLEERSRYGNLPANVEWSSGTSLEADLGEARWALYRGSSAIIAALAKGVMPIYLAMPDEDMSIDPLFALKSFRKIVHNGSEFRSVLEEPAAYPEDILAEARDFVEKYYRPVDEQALTRLLQDV